jgi:hypothetical protein
MRQRRSFSLVMILLPVLLAAGCPPEEPGIPPTFTYDSLTHRGEHLVLAVAAVVPPDSTPANVTCTGPVPASGVGEVRDSVPVVHHDTARTFSAICTAEADGARTTDTVTHTLYGPNTKGDWLGEGALPLGMYGLTIRDEATSSANSAWITRLDGSTARAYAHVVVNRSGDSVTVAASVDPSWWSGPVMRGRFELEYRSIVGHVGGLDGCGGCDYTLRRN